MGSMRSRMPREELERLERFEKQHQQLKDELQGVSLGAFPASDLGLLARVMGLFPYPPTQEDLDLLEERLASLRK